MNLGKSVLNHYESFLGKYIGVDKYTSDEKKIQILGFDKTFRDCLVFASFGFSNYSSLINNLCEVIMPVDDDYDNCAILFVNALFYVIQQKMNFGRGTIIEGIDNIITDFSKRHNKTAIYFTESYILPEEFSKIEDDLKMYMAFLISERERDFIYKYGCEQFENLLENEKVDIINVNRKSIV